MTFVNANGKVTEVDAEVGLSVMKVAVNGGIDGIDADCGGACTCGTCHVFIAREWLDRLPAVDEMEEATLEFAVGQQDTSRLSCQLELTPALDGLVVEIPARQF